ncbi:oocyte zinc finger protein XlCOF7.1-like isoform X2 [Dendropsophus ebraccatus]
MHICKERGGISEFLHHSLMTSKDKMEVTEKILSLTLEIIFLLTGEDLVLSKKQNNQQDDSRPCVSEGSTKDRSPCREPPAQSPAREETPEEQTPSETTHPTAEEVPVRCEDVAIFFSMEEWEYLEGHKERYKDVVSESRPTPVSDGSDRVNAAETAVDEGKELNDIQVDPVTTIPDPPPTVSCSITENLFSSCKPSTSDQCTAGAALSSTQRTDTLVSCSITENLFSSCKPSTSDQCTAGAALSSTQRTDTLGEPIPSDEHTPTGGNIPRDPPECCMSPLPSEKCPEEDDREMTQEYQAPPVDEISPPRCKEEDDPVEISSGDHSPVNLPEMSGSPVRPLDCIGEDNRVVPQEYQAKMVNTLPIWRKKKPNPPKIRSGPTSWKVQPDSPHLLIPVRHKNGVISTNREVNSSNTPPMVVMVKPKNILHEAPPLRNKPELTHLYWQKPRIDASSSGLMNYGGGAINLPPVMESPAAHKCLQCGRSFRSDVDLISHQRTHEKMYHCALCQQSFMDKSALVVHEWTFHIHEPKIGEPQPKPAAKDDRPFTCLECGKSFMKKSSLVKHQRIHTGAFACPDCGKCLSDKTGLIIHRRTHTGEKPYACSECGRRFTQRCHLITHQSVHTSKESFACSDCGKCFSVRSVLEAHQAFHNRHRTFTCSDCGKCFLQRSALMAHSKIHANHAGSMS